MADLIPLKKAVELTLLNSPQYLSAKKSAEMSHLQSVNISRSILPSLDLTSTHGPQGFEPNLLNLPRTQSSTQLTLTETLYDNGERVKQSEISRLTTDLNQIALEKIKAKTILQAIEAYYRWNTSALQLDISKKYSDTVKRNSRLATQLFRNGIKTQKDDLLFRTLSRRSELSYSEAERQVEKNRKQLLILLGILGQDGSTEFALLRKPPQTGPLKIPSNTEDLYENRELALKNQIGEKQVDLVKAKNRPEIFLTGQAQYGSTQYLDTGQSFSDNQQTSWNVLLTLKWNLLDWGTRTRNTQIEVLKQNIETQSYRSTLNDAEKEFEEFKIEAADALKNHQIISEIEQMELNANKILSQDYQLGRIGTFDLSTGLSNLLDAQSKKLQSDFDISFLSFKAQYYEGKLNEDSIQN